MNDLICSCMRLSLNVNKLSIFDDKWNVTFTRIFELVKMLNIFHLIINPLSNSLIFSHFQCPSIGYVKGLCQSHHVNYNSFKYLHSNWKAALWVALRVIHAWQHTSNRWVRMFGRKFVLELAFFSISFYVNDCCCCYCYIMPLMFIFRAPFSER